MKNKKMMVIFSFFLLSMMTPTYFVWANNDEYEEHNRDEGEDHEEEYDRDEGEDHEEEHDRDKGEDHEEDNGYEYEENYEGDAENWQQTPVESTPAPVESISATTWDVWSRTASLNEGTLPFDVSKTVKFENQDGKMMDSYVIPTNGQIMIPTVKTAELVGATVKYYKTTKIAEMQLDGNELIVKSGSNAVYENDTKTPMPAEAMLYQNELYIPISVLTNGLGLTVKWNEAKQTFLIQQ